MSCMTVKLRYDYCTRLINNIYNISQLHYGMVSFTSHGSMTTNICFVRQMLLHWWIRELQCRSTVYVRVLRAHLNSFNIWPTYFVQQKLNEYWENVGWRECSNGFNDIRYFQEQRKCWSNVEWKFKPFKFDSTAAVCFQQAVNIFFTLSAMLNLHLTSGFLIYKKNRDLKQPWRQRQREVRKK